MGAKQTPLLRLLIVFSTALLALFLACLPTSKASAAAGINSQLSFEGKIVNSSGLNISDGTYNMQFKIYQDGNGCIPTSGCNTDPSTQNGGTLKWTENRLIGGSGGVALSSGTFQVNLGSVNAFGTSVDWNQDTLWLSLQIGNTSSCTITTTFQSNCSGDGEMISFIRLTAVPYANNSAALSGLVAGNFVQLAQGVQTDTSTSNASIAINKNNASGTPNILQLQKASNNVMVLDNNGFLSLTPAANLTSGKTHIAQSFTNASSTGGTVTGFSQAVTVNNTSSASTTKAINIALTDATSLANTDYGLSVDLSGITNSSAVKIAANFNGGSVIQTTNGPVYQGGADSSGATNSGGGGEAFNATFVQGKYLYAVKAGSTTTCAGSAGDFSGCELQIYDVTQPGSPKYIGGADESGAAPNTGTTGSRNFNSIYVSGKYAYITQTNDTGTCSSTQGSAVGCELKVFDISKPSAPNYVGGADADGTTNGGSGGTAGTTDLKSVFVSARYAYVTQVGSATACAQSAGSAIGCELKIFDIANPSRPAYLAGEDVSGSLTGSGNLQENSVFVSGGYAYVTNDGNFTTCSQAIGSAIGCELQVYNISNPASPSYVGGADISGATNGGSGSNDSVFTVYVSGRYAYTGHASDATDCSGPGGNYSGCELQVYDVSNPGSPTYVGGADTSGLANSGTTAINGFASISVSGQYLYAVQGGASISACSGTAGSAGNCEFQIYNISNPASPAYAGGADTSGLTNAGSLGGSLNSVFISGRYAYATRSGGFPTCSGVAGSAVGCELQVYDVTGLAATSVTAGSLQTGILGVQNAANFNDQVSIAGSLTVGQSTQLNGNLGSAGLVTFQNSANSTSAFQVQNASGISLFKVDTSNSIVTVHGATDSTQGFQIEDKLSNGIVNINTVANDNLLLNGSFEEGSGGTTNNTSGWSKLNGSETQFLTAGSNAQDGTRSLQVTVQTSALQGAEYLYTFKPNTNYVFSVYTSVSSNNSGVTTSAAVYDIGATVNGSDVTCTGNGNTLTFTTAVTRWTCAFTTGSTTTPSDYVFVRRKSSDANIRSIHIDAAMLEYGTSASTNYANPGLSLTNLLPFGSFENSNTNGWGLHAAGTGASVAVSTDLAKYGIASLKLVTGTAGDNGTEYRYPFSPNTEYSLSFWARVSVGGTSTALNVGHNDNPGSLGTATGDTNCTTTPDISAASAVTTNWTQYTCSFTTASTVGGSSNFFIKQPTADTTSDTIQIDGVTLVQSSAGLSFTPIANGIDFNNQTNNLILNGSGSGELQPWRLNNIPIGAASTSGSPVTREQAATVVANGYAYIIGGYDGSNAQNTVYSAKVNADGSVQGWTAAANTLPAVIRYASAAVANGYLYVIGGANTAGTAQTSIWYSKLGSDGTPGTWQTNAVSLPAAKLAPSVVVVNGLVYILGGCSDTTCTVNSLATIHYGKLNANGSIQGVTASSALTATTQSLPNARGMGQAVYANGDLYFIGGAGNTNGTPNAAGPKQDIYWVPIASGGDITTAFTSAAGSQLLPGARALNSSVIANGYIYTIGGCSALTSGTCSSGSATNNVWYSALNGDGTIGGWLTASNLLPSSRGAPSAFVTNGYVYILGGFDGTNRTSTVYYASTPRTLVGGSLDLVGLNGQGLADYGGAGALTAGNTRVVGDLKVDGYADFNNGLSVDSALSINAVTGSLGQTIFNINNSNSNSIFSIQHMGTNFGSLATAGAFMQKNSYFGEEFNVGHNIDCLIPTVAGNGINSYARGDYGNAGTATACTTAGANVGGGELNFSYVLGASSGSCAGITVTSAANGVERIQVTGSATVNSTWNCVESLARSTTQSNQIYAAANLPVLTMKLKATVLTSSNNDRLQVGMVNGQSAGGTGSNSPASSIYFTNCSTWNNGAAPTGCGTTNWYGVTSGAAAATVVTCSTGSGSLTANFSYLRVEVRSTTDVHFFADYNTSDGINESECGTGSTSNVSASTMTPWLQTLHTVNNTNGIQLDVDYIRSWQDDNINTPATQAAEEAKAPNGQDLITTPPLAEDAASPDDPSGLFSFNAASSEDTVYNHNVYIHGTIFADKIVANQIEGLDVFADRLGSLQEQLAKDKQSSGVLSGTASAAALPLNLNINGALSVGGPAEFHGNAVFYKLVTFMEKTVFNNDVTFAAHVTTAGDMPTVTLADASGITTAPDNPDANLASAKITGNDNSGQLVIKVGDNATAGDLLNVKFKKDYDKPPQVLVTAANAGAAQIRIYVTASNDGFKLSTTDPPPAGLELHYYYWVVK